MKRIIIFFASFLGMALGFNACQDMDDIHSKYLDGELIYAPKPLIIQTFAGKNRIGVKYYLVNAVNVDKCIVEWDEGTKTQSVDITPKLPLDSVEFMINNLEEKSYLFKIYTVDKNGNRSVKEQVTGSSYDSKYAAGLTNRSIISIEGGGTIDSVTINWGTAPEGNTKVELSYTNSDGLEVKKSVSADENVTVLRGWKSESKLTYHSFFIPEANAIDTFMSAASEETLPAFIEFEGVKIDKSKWEIVDFSTEEPAEGAPNGLASAAIDNNLNTFWHTQWNGGSPGYPHHFTVDLKDVVKISKIETFRRQGDSRGQTEFQIHTSLDGVNFSLVGTFTYDASVNSMSYNLPSLPMARFVKYVATKGSNFFAFLAELDLYGQVATNLDKTNWTIAGFSSEEPKEADWGPAIQGRAAAAVDNDLGTFWHSAWDQSQPPYPHYFTVDLQESKRILAVECFRRQGNGNGQTKFKLYTSNDGVNFEEQGEFNFNAQTDDGQLYPLAFLPTARYIKYEATAGPNHYAFLAEMNVYIQESE